LVAGSQLFLRFVEAIDSTSMEARFVAACTTASSTSGSAAALLHNAQFKPDVARTTKTVFCWMRAFATSGETNEAWKHGFKRGFESGYKKADTGAAKPAF